MADQVTEFIARELLGEPGADISADTPLLEWGVLNSLNISRLIVFVNDRFAVEVPPEAVTGSNFKTAGTVAAMVCSLSGDGAGTAAASGQ